MLSLTHLEKLKIDRRIFDLVFNFILRDLKKNRMFKKNPG